MVIGAEGQRGVAFEVDRVVDFDGRALAVFESLIGDGPVLDELACGGIEDEVTLRIEARFSAVFKGEGDARGVGVGGDDEVVFELLGVAVVVDINARVELRDVQAAVGGDTF